MLYILYMVTWIPSIYPLYVSINIPAPWIPWSLGHPQTLRALGVLRHRDVAKCHRAGLQLGCTGSTGEGLPGRVEDMEDMMCGSKDREDWDLDQRNHKNFGFLKARDGDFLLL